MTTHYTHTHMIAPFSCTHTCARTTEKAIPPSHRKEHSVHTFVSTPQQKCYLNTVKTWETSSLNFICMWMSPNINLRYVLELELTSHAHMSLSESSRSLEWQCPPPGYESQSSRNVLLSSLPFPSPPQPVPHACPPGSPDSSPHLAFCNCDLPSPK